MIKNPNAKITFTDKDKAILSVNHNYFMRTAIATFSDMFLTLLIYIIIGVVVTFVCLMMNTYLEDHSQGVHYPLDAIAFLVDGLLAFIYFIYTIVKIARISKMRKHVNHIENEIIERSTTKTTKEEPSEE